MTQVRGCDCCGKSYTVTVTEHPRLCEGCAEQACIPDEMCKLAEEPENPMLEPREVEQKGGEEWEESWKRATQPWLFEE